MIPYVHNIIKSCLSEPNARIQIAKPIQFDPPKTPFEERLQQQAHAIRKASAASLAASEQVRKSTYDWSLFPPAYYTTRKCLSTGLSHFFRANSGRKVVTFLWWGVCTIETEPVLLLLVSRFLRATQLFLVILDARDTAFAKV
ncbi:unnamed protein product [Cylicostephanus goldi]|uniref:Uncharacterized protein n=1 Tax=Cylicostephanus goldi TaxID=71465 RepID=A0A3P7N2N0_CYLGO|nr:unnamed protein product [Cylicostephanus goldi]